MRKISFILIVILLEVFIGVSGLYISIAQEYNKNYKQDMRDFIKNISSYAKNKKKDFIIIPQNGQELLTENGLANDKISIDYINAIDGIGREDLFYGYDGINKLTPLNEQNKMIKFLDIAKNNGLVVMVTDYCFTKPFVDNSYKNCDKKGYISFVAADRELNKIPKYPAKPNKVNNLDIVLLKDARNFLYLINPNNFSTKKSFLNAIKKTDFDVVIIDLFYNDIALTADDINLLKNKNTGGKRLVICYMSIGEAEDYRYYWHSVWKKNKPEWLLSENPNWKGNYKVCYWNKNWQKIIYGTDDSYLDKIIKSGFDGVYLDIVDAFEYFEN